MSAQVENRVSPAPWVFGVFRGSSVEIVAPTANIGESIVADVHGMTADDATARRPNANARLIVKAPKLLDALEEIVRAVDNDDGVQSAIAHAETLIGEIRG